MRALSLSLDLDNLWSYQKTHGDEGWQDFPTYLEPLTEVLLERLEQHRLEITVFVVGQDAALEKNHLALQRIAAAGHEIGNHSFRHEPWLHRYSTEELHRELEQAEGAIEQATGRTPVGFRGPGFSVSAELLAVLAARGYQYDASTLPTFLGPLARLYYFRKSRGLSTAEREQRSKLFGGFRQGLLPLDPYVWREVATPLVEIPVTTIPGVRMPFHLSYLLYLAGFSRRLAFAYLDLAIAACRLTGTEPSFLLHPLDLLGGDRVQGLDFFPGMNLATDFKLDFFDRVMTRLQRRFEVVPMREHCRRIVENSGQRRLRRVSWGSLS